MADLIWLHEDMLRATHPVFAHAGDDATAIFIWDDAYFDVAGYSLKRRVFLYETICQLPVDIYRGDMMALLGQLAEAAAAQKIYTGTSPNPALQKIMQELSVTHELTQIDDEPFVTLDRTADLKRFFRYWNQARKTAFDVDGAN
jgi:hypothetical protein